jgi:hypothetical protein
MNKIFLVLVLITVTTCSLKKTEVTDELLMTVSIGGRSSVSFRIGLFGGVVPITASNFAGLCKGDKKTSDGTPLSFITAPFHRVIPNFML